MLAMSSLSTHTECARLAPGLSSPQSLAFCTVEHPQRWCPAKIWLFGFEQVGVDAHPVAVGGVALGGKELLGAALQRRWPQKRRHSRVGVLAGGHEIVHHVREGFGVEAGAVGQPGDVGGGKQVRGDRLGEGQVAQHWRHPGPQAHVVVGGGHRLGVGVERGWVVVREVHMVEHRGAAGLQHFQRPGRGGGVSVIGGARNAGEHGPHQPQVERQVRGGAPVQRLTRMGVRVDEPWHGEHALAVHHLCRPCGEAWADLGDHSVGCANVGLAHRPVGLQQVRSLDHQVTHHNTLLSPCWRHMAGARLDELASVGQRAVTPRQQVLLELGGHRFGLCEQLLLVDG